MTLAATCAILLALSLYDAAVDHRSPLLICPAGAGLAATYGAWRVNRRV